MKNPNELSIVELKAFIFDLQSDTQLCLQILREKLEQEKKPQGEQTS
jgi:hypothetical protein